MNWAQKAAAGVFPARAGMNRATNIAWWKRESVPRTRGDEPPVSALTFSTFIVFPARAGMNRSETTTQRIRRCVPRTRGDEPEMLSKMGPALMCSPHARG